MDVSDIFHFFCSKEGKGESEALGGEDFLLKIPGGGLPGGWARGGRGAGRVCAGNSGGGRGGKFLFSGPKFPPSPEQARKVAPDN